MNRLWVIVLLFGCVVVGVLGHGMMLDPPNRSSLWRYNSSFPINYNDNENFCGGFGVRLLPFVRDVKCKASSHLQVQYYQNGGKCGLCGDNYADPQPRKNENTGKYGLGYIVKTYNAGNVIDVSVLLTANHLGYFQFGYVFLLLLLIVNKIVFSLVACVFWKILPLLSLEMIVSSC